MVPTTMRDVDSLSSDEGRLTNSPAHDERQVAKQDSRSMFSMTYDQRRKLCEYAEEHPELNQKQLITWFNEQFNVSPSQAAISRCLKRKRDILGSERSRGSSLRRIKKVTYPLMEDALAQWCMEYRNLIPIDGNLIKQQGAYFLKTLYPKATEGSFHFSDGWLGRFKTRHGIKSEKYGALAGNTAAEQQHFSDSLEALQSQVARYAPKDVFLIDETGIFYQSCGIEIAARCLSSEEIEELERMPGAFPGIGKERATLSVCMNADGSEKLPCWLIGRFPHPLCFQGVDRSNLGIRYLYTPQAKMTADAFSEYMMWFDGNMKGRRVLLIADYCPAHLSFNGHLANTELHILPPNTSMLGMHPGEIGITRMLKAFYRRRFAEIMFSRAEVGDPRIFLTIMEAMTVITQAWEEDLVPKYIVECWLNSHMLSDKAIRKDAPSYMAEFRQQLRQRLSDLRRLALGLTPGMTDFIQAMQAQTERSVSAMPEMARIMSYSDGEHANEYLTVFEDLHLAAPPIHEVVYEIQEEAEKLSGQPLGLAAAYNGGDEVHHSVVSHERGTYDTTSSADEIFLTDNEPYESLDVIPDFIHSERARPTTAVDRNPPDYTKAGLRPIVTDCQALNAINVLEQYWLRRSPASLRLSLPIQRREVLKRMEKEEQ